LTGRGGYHAKSATMNQLTCNYVSNGSSDESDGSETFPNPQAKDMEDGMNARKGSEAGAVFEGVEK
jgi:hypothetical protein